MTAGSNYEADLAAFGGPTDDDRNAIMLAKSQAAMERVKRDDREADYARQRTDAIVAEVGHPPWEQQPPAEGWDEEAAKALDDAAATSAWRRQGGRCADCNTRDDVNRNGELPRCARCQEKWEHEPKEPTATTPTERLRAALIRGDDVLSIPPPAPLIDGLLDLDTLAVVYGPSGSAKTFLAIDWGLSVSTGSWWLGHEVTKGPVLYVVAEGLGGLGIRVRAWQDHHRVHSSGEAAWLPLAVNLLDPGWMAALADLVAELQPRLVVLDTLARCMVGGNENDAKDIGMAVAAADMVRRACRACVLIVHHSGKDVSAGARGSSALKAAMSTEIECTADDGVVTVKVTKQKDHSTEARPIRLALVLVGDSCALEPYRGGAGLPDGALDLLRELLAIDVGEGVSSTTWRLSSGVAERSFYRWQKGLIEEGYCHKTGDKTQARYTVTEQGKEAVSGE